MNRRLTKVVLWGSLSLVSAAWPLAPLAADSEEIIKYRKAVMKSQAGHMGAAAKIVLGKVDFRDDLLYHARALDASSKTVGALFPPDSDFGDTRAKPEVWDKRADFEKAVSELEKRAAAFLKVVESNDKATLGRAFRALSDACKGCHKDFREKKEE